jgi:hypothetical protein
MTEHESTIDLNPAADEIIDDNMAVDDGMSSFLLAPDSTPALDIEYVENRARDLV